MELFVVWLIFTFFFPTVGFWLLIGWVGMWIVGLGLYWLDLMGPKKQQTSPEQIANMDYQVAQETDQLYK